MKICIIKEQSQNLILFGYKSSGKSYFGKRLADELKCTFIDTDKLVENLYQKEFHEECNSREISIKLGEAGFRNLEEKVIEGLRGTTNAIIALGGGSILSPQNFLILKSLGTLIYLEADKETIKQRIFNGELPSFFDLNAPEKSFEIMYEERRPIYEKVSSFKLRVQGKSDQEVLEDLISIRYCNQTF